MSIKINKITLLEDMIQFREVFDTLMRNIEDRGSKNEFETRLYQRLYHEVICEKADNYQKDRLSLQSLLDNGMFVHSNLNAGTTAVQPIMVKLFRFLSEKKTSAMSHAGFNRIRAGFEVLQRTIIQNGSVSDEHYLISLMELREMVSDTISEVRQSIDALKQSVVDLSEQYKKMQEHGSSYESESKLLDSISRLHTHYALPCYQFIDQDLDLREGLTVTQSIKGLIDFHNEYDMPSTSLSLEYELSKITSYYKDIEALVGQLNSYSQYLSQSRQKYMAIDAAFESLMVDARALRHGRKNKAKLTPESRFIEGVKTFDGAIPKSLYQQRINWIESVSLLRFEEWLRMTTGEEKKVSQELLKPIHSQPSPSSQRRMAISMTIMRKLRLPKEGVEDVVVYIHKWMMENQEDYHFIDILPAIQAFYSIYTKSELSNTADTKKLIYDGYYLNYLRVAKQEISA